MSILIYVNRRARGEDLDETATTKTVGSSSTVAVDPEIQGHSMDDILPGTKAPPIPVIFADVPVHTETELGSSVLLACRAAHPVAECQWSWPAFATGSPATSGYQRKPSQFHQLVIFTSIILLLKLACQRSTPISVVEGSFSFRGGLNARMIDEQ